MCPRDGASLLPALSPTRALLEMRALTITDDGKNAFCPVVNNLSFYIDHGGIVGISALFRGRKTQHRAVAAQIVAADSYWWMVTPVVAVVILSTAYFAIADAFHERVIAK